jgi:uncharacterized protein (TIGR00369 family)
MDDEPVRGDYPPAGFLRLPGIERMRAGMRGVMPIPPNAHLTGLRSVDVGPGLSTFTMPASPWLQAAGGMMLAGVSALVNDAPLGGAILTTVPPGVYGVTSELSLNFLRPPTLDGGEFTARARLINAGRSLGLSEATVEDARGNVLSFSTSRYVLMRFDAPPEPMSLEPYPEPEYPTPAPHLRDVPAELLPKDDALALSGIEFHRAVIAGEIRSPFAELFGIRATGCDEGSARFAVRASRWLTSPARNVYGGAIAFLADAASMAAVTTTLPAGHSAATLDLKVQFLRPGIADDRDLDVRAHVVHRGNRLAVTRAEIVNADGKPIALATGSTMILPRPWQSVAVADEPTDEES